MTFPGLPDSVWLNIFSYLHHQDLISVIELGKNTNWSPGIVAQDKTLWKSVLWTVSKPLKNNKKCDIKKIIPYLKKYTTAIHIEGCQGKGKSLPVSEALLRSVRLHCTGLRYLTLVNVRLDYYSLPMRNLPQSLTHLTLKNVQFDNLPCIRTMVNSPFMSANKSLTNLRRIFVHQNCDWFRKEDVALIRKLMPLVTLEQ
jgi:hypothetical protein